MVGNVRELSHSFPWSFQSMPILISRCPPGSFSWGGPELCQPQRCRMDNQHCDPINIRRYCLDLGSPTTLYQVEDTKDDVQRGLYVIPTHLKAGGLTCKFIGACVVSWALVLLYLADNIICKEITTNEVLVLRNNRLHLWRGIQPVGGDKGRQDQFLEGKTPVAQMQKDH